MVDTHPGAGKTFFIVTPSDLLEKLRFEAGEFTNRSPFNLKVRAYIAMNCAITAWQMKDWVYSALKTEKRLKVLDEFAGRKIKNAKDFGAYLMGKCRDMALCYQIATASKHFQVECHPDSNVQTAITPVHIPIRGGYERDELVILDGDEKVYVSSLVWQLHQFWSTTLRQLGLPPGNDPFVPNDG